MQLNWAKQAGECKKISERASKFVKYIVTANGLKNMLRAFVEPMKNFIQAYNDEARRYGYERVHNSQLNGELIAGLYSPPIGAILSQRGHNVY